MLSVFEPVVTFPLVRVRVALTVSFAPSVMPAALLIVKPLKVVDVDPFIVWPEPPLKVTVPVPCVNDPLFVHSPLTFILKLLPPVLSVVPEPIVSVSTVVAAPSVVMPVVVVERILYEANADGREFVAVRVIVPRPGVSVS